MKLFRPLRRPLSPEALILAVSIYTVSLGNIAFFRALSAAYPDKASAGTILSVGLLLVAIMNLTFGLFGWGRPLKVGLTLSLVLTAFLSYAADALGIVGDETMVLNLLKTDRAEVGDLLTFKLFAYFFFLACMPAFLIFRTRLEKKSRSKALGRRALSMGLSAVAAIAVMACSNGFYASFFREHKALRSYINPIHFVYSATKYANSRVTSGQEPFVAIGSDARIPASDVKRDLIIAVIGETARADHFSLNGYGVDTNPNLRAAGAISLPNLWSCGTSTAVSVPCMFSALGRANYSETRGHRTANLLDVLSNTGDIRVLWRDNNSDAKGVADRLGQEDFKTAEKNPVCDEECRDVGMLSGLQEMIDKEPKKDIFIVLHQMGNHGPAYYHRYPAAFEKFKPACHTNELSSCTPQEISNAYDNALLYTDYFLGETIKLLKQNSAKFETAMLYVSDHGESLGERGIYLHGLPYMLAPEAQKRPAAAVWLGSIAHRIDVAKFRQRAKTELSHDNFFHTVLGLFEISTKEYRPELDILH